MAKTLISRLDAENIVRAAVDPDTHEATGDVYDSVNDVSYPFGGGGSGDIPKTCTVKFIDPDNTENWAVSDMLTMPFTYENGIYEFNETDIDADGTDIKLLYSEYNNVVRTYPPLNSDEISALDVTPTDLVNCSYDADDQQINITDSSLDSSITLTIGTK